VEQETDKASPARKIHHEELVTTLLEITLIDETWDVTSDEASSCITVAIRREREEQKPRAGWVQMVCMMVHQVARFNCFLV
jgi:hypothetical protein